MTTSPRKGRLQLLPVAIFIAIAGLFAVALKTGDPSKLPSVLIGKSAPASEFPPIEGLFKDGQPVRGFTNSDLATGKVSLVNFWASWCAECVAEHALLQDIKSKTGVMLYGVDYKDTAAAALRFLNTHGNPYDAVGTDSNGRTAIEWGVYGMPETFVVNGRGEVVYKHIGAITQASFEAKIMPAINAAGMP